MSARAMLEHVNKSAATQLAAMFVVVLLDINYKMIRPLVKVGCLI